MNSKCQSMLLVLMLFSHESLSADQGTSVSPEEYPVSMTLAYKANPNPTESGILSSDSPINFTQIELDSEVASAWEWSWHPMAWAWPWWVTLQMVFAILGMAGNLLVILVVFWKNSASRSTDILLGNLAIADFLLSIVMIPIPTARTIRPSIAGKLYCIFIRSPALTWMFISVSSYFLVTISVDRYFAVVHPLVFNRMVTKGRVYICVTLVWLMFMFSGSKDLFVYKLDHVTGRCVNPRFPPGSTSAIAYASYTFCLRFVIPTTIILLTQLLIAKKLHQEGQRFSRTLTEGSVSSKPSFHVTARARVLKMLLIVIIVFFICWAPGQIAFFSVNMGFIPRNYLGSALHHSFITLSFFNSCVNPFIYTASNLRFREALRDIFVCSRSSHDPIFEHKVEMSVSSDTTAMSSVAVI